MLHNPFLNRLAPFDARSFNVGYTTRNRDDHVTAPEAASFLIATARTGGPTDAVACVSAFRAITPHPIFDFANEEIEQHPAAGDAIRPIMLARNCGEALESLIVGGFGLASSCAQYKMAQLGLTLGKTRRRVPAAVIMLPFPAPLPGQTRTRTSPDTP